MENSKAKKIIKLHDRLRRTSNFDETWRQCAMYVLPDKDDIHTFLNKSRGEEKNLQLYDSSAQHYNELLASALHSMLTNPSSQWFELATDSDKLNKNPKVRKYLQELVKTIHRILNNSNFQSEIHELYLDLGCFGTGVLYVEEDDELIIRFTSRPIYEIRIAENSKSEVDTITLTYKMTVENLIEKFGDSVPEEVRQKYSGEPDKKLEVVFAVLPKHKCEGEKKSNFEFISYHVLKEGCILLKQGGYNEFPYITPRWIKVTGEVYGRSPTMKSLPTIRMLQSMMRTVIRGAQKIVDPALQVPDDGFIGRFQTYPGGLNPYRAGTRDRIEPILTGGNPGLGMDIISDTRNRIKENYFIDQLQLQDGPQMTATEVNARVEEHLRLLGPILGRLHFELLQPLIARIIGIIKRKNLFPPDMPEELRDVSPRIFFTSQIARAQRLSEAQSLDAYLMSITPLLQMDPNTIDLLNIDNLIRYKGELHGIPVDTLNDEEVVEQRRENKAQLAEQQLSQEQEMAEAQKANMAAPLMQQ